MIEDFFKDNGTKKSFLLPSPASYGDPTVTDTACDPPSSRVGLLDISLPSVAEFINRVFQEIPADLNSNLANVDVGAINLTAIQDKSQISANSSSDNVLVLCAQEDDYQILNSPDQPCSSVNEIPKPQNNNLLRYIPKTN